MHILVVQFFLHFSHFSYSTSISKLNNFTRLESSFHLLGISFDANVAQALMQEKPGVAARLLYQLYFSLERKRTTQISGAIMEIMKPAATVGLHKKEQEIYSNVRMPKMYYYKCTTTWILKYLDDLALCF